MTESFSLTFIFLFIKCFYSSMKSPESGFCLSHISQVPRLLRTLQLTASVNIHICRLGLYRSYRGTKSVKAILQPEQCINKRYKNPTKTLQVYVTLCCLKLRPLIKVNMQRTHSLVHKNTSVLFLSLLKPSK